MSGPEEVVCAAEEARRSIDLVINMDVDVHEPTAAGQCPGVRP